MERPHDVHEWWEYGFATFYSASTWDQATRTGGSLYVSVVTTMDGEIVERHDGDILAVRNKLGRAGWLCENPFIIERIVPQDVVNLFSSASSKAAVSRTQTQIHMRRMHRSGH